jgi:hypothetical protein
MRRRAAMAVIPALGLLAACQGAPPPQEAVLTLVPTAMQITGSFAPAWNDPSTACLIAGASIEARIHVSRSPVTVILIAFTPTPAPIPSFELRVGSRLVAMDVIPTVSPRILAYNVNSDRGEQVVRVAVPVNSPGILCVQQVAVTQR